MRWLLLAAGLFAAPASAYELRRLSISHQGEDYRVTLEAELAAPAGLVYARLTDFAALAGLNPSLRVLSLSPPDTDGQQRVLTEADFCVLSLCRLLRHSQRVRSLKGEEGGSILAVTEPPPASDFRRGEAQWTVSAAAAGHSRLRFEASLAPDFWLAPVLGPWMLERRLREEALTAVHSLEQQAGAGSP